MVNKDNYFLYLDMRYFQSLFIFFLLFVFLSCVNQDVNNNIFKYNETSSITSLDPIFANNQSNIWAVNQIFNTLTVLDQDLNIKPSIAKSWHQSLDGLKYTFILRDDVFFHHSPCFGIDSTRKLIAEDFIYSISRLHDTNNLSPGAWVIDYINTQKTYALNDTVLEVYLNKPFPGLLGLLSMSYFSFVPKEAVQYFGENFSQNPIGSGPFYFKKWIKNEKLILRKNNFYFEYDQNKVRLPYLDGVAISFITQKESVFMNFILGNFDFVSGLDNSFKDEFLNSEGGLVESYKDRFKLMTTPYLNTEYLGINIVKATKEQSPLRFKNVRKALNYSFDRNIMAKYLRNDLVTPASHGFVPTILSNCYDVQGYFYSPDSVFKLLNGIPDKNLEIKLHTTQDYLDVCEFIQHSASKFGIRISIEISSPAVHRKLFSSSGASLFRASWIGDYPDPENFLSLFYSKNKSPLGPNYTHFSNANFDNLYEKSFNSQSEEERCRLFFEMEELLLEESVVVPLYYDHVVRLVSNNIEGMFINGMNTLNLKKVKKN